LQSFSKKKSIFNPFPPFYGILSFSIFLPPVFVMADIPPPTPNDVAAVAQLDVVAQQNLQRHILVGGTRGYATLKAPPSTPVLFVGIVSKIFFGNGSGGEDNGGGNDGVVVTTADDIRFVNEGDSCADTTIANGLVGFKVFKPTAPLRLNLTKSGVPNPVEVEKRPVLHVKVFGTVPRGLHLKQMAVVYARATGPTDEEWGGENNPSFLTDVYYGDMMLLLERWIKSVRLLTQAVAAQALLALLTMAVATQSDKLSLSLKLAGLSYQEVCNALVVAGITKDMKEPMACAVATVYSDELRAVLEAFPLLNPMAACDLVEFCKKHQVRDTVQLCQLAPYQAAAIAVQQNRVRGLRAQDELAIYTLGLNSLSSERVRRFLVQGVHDLIRGYQSNFERATGGSHVPGNDAPMVPLMAAIQQAWMRYQQALHDDKPNLCKVAFEKMAISLASNNAAPWFPRLCATRMDLPADFGLTLEPYCPDSQAWLYPTPLYVAECRIATILMAVSETPLCRVVPAYHRTPGGGDAVLRMHTTGRVPDSIAPEAKLKPYKYSGMATAHDSLSPQPLMPGEADPGGARDETADGRWRMDAVQLSIAHGMLKQHNVMCMTGAGGTGKTDATAATVDALVAEGFIVVYISFTGRAVENARERLGMRACAKLWGGGPMTAHRFVTKVVMTGAQPFTYMIDDATKSVNEQRAIARTHDDPMAPDRPIALVVDEASMLSLLCLGAVLSVPHFAWARILLVGDPVQLPSIDPGTMFHELLRPPKPQLPTVVLNYIYRSDSATAKAGTLIRAFIAEDEAAYLLGPSAARHHPIDGVARLAVLEDYQVDEQFELYLLDALGGRGVTPALRLAPVLQQYDHQMSPCPVTGMELVTPLKRQQLRVWLTDLCRANSRVMVLATHKAVAHELAVTARRQINEAASLPDIFRFAGHKRSLYQSSALYWNEIQDGNWRIGDRVMCCANLYVKDGTGQRMLAANGFMGVLIAGAVDLRTMRERPEMVADCFPGFTTQEIELMSRWLPETYVDQILAMPRHGDSDNTACLVVVVAPSNAIVQGQLSADKLHVFPLKIFIQNFCLAYACTVHKAQGSEWDRVDSHPDSGMLNTAQILYTSITRAKTRGRVLGLRRTLEQALSDTLSIVRRPSLFLVRIEVERRRLADAGTTDGLVWVPLAGEEAADPNQAQGVFTPQQLNVDEDTEVSAVAVVNVSRAAVEVMLKKKQQAFSDTSLSGYTFTKQRHLYVNSAA
jgi:hypothetical protein